MDSLKNTAIPEGLDANEADLLLKETGGEPDLGRRLERISEHFLGRAYVAGSLGGGPGLPEVLRVSLDAFDCVTFMEAVFALGLSRTVDEFVDTICRIRYDNGRIDWLYRNHYMVDWASNNEKRGLIANLTDGPATLQKTCTLGMISGLPPRTLSFRYSPRQSINDFLELVHTGDMILFVSAKDSLDVFHTGILFRLEEEIRLRHATRTAGAVIEQALTDFVSNNEMAGFVLLRPLCRR